MPNEIQNLVQTPFMVYGEDGALRQKIIVTVSWDGQCDAELSLDGVTLWTGALSPGINEIKAWIPEPEAPQRQRVLLRAEAGQWEFDADLTVPKRWEVHVVHLSHHDPGFTDLPSRVLNEQAGHLLQALNDLDTRAHYPWEARPRIVVEQCWSLDHFLHVADPLDRQRMLTYIARGDIEITALFGNLITEQLGHEECLRAMEFSSRIAGLAGVELVSAEHNDITGISWGLCRALSDAGVKIFCPGIPLYYDWGDHNLFSFWDQKAIFDYEGPGAFWWESPNGARLLVWCNNSGCGGDNDPHMSQLIPSLLKLEADGWPHEVIRWPVNGAFRDNAPYIGAYADTVKAWNETYAYPRLIMSTNAMFYRSFTDKLSVELPVRRGELPGQDYPVGAMGQSLTTSISRETHTLLAAAESLATLASGDALLADQRPIIESAYRDLLLADEHAYGHHFPAGPAMRASLWEYAAMAGRASALAHDIMTKAMASIADRVEGPVNETEGIRLVVFNMSGVPGIHAVETPMREIENTIGAIMPSNRDPGRLRMYNLNNRLNVKPQDGYLRGEFVLIDEETGNELDFELSPLTYDAPEPFAAERYGLSRGTRRLSLFEEPAGNGLTLRFIGPNLPSYGYRCYTLRLTETAPSVSAGEDENKNENTIENTIENEFYRIQADKGGVCSLVDIRDGFEMLDAACPHRLGDLLSRDANETETEKMRVCSVTVRKSMVRQTIDIVAAHPCAHALRIRLSLYKDVDAVMASVRYQQDSKPLQGVYMAFPFAGKGFRYQGVLSEMEPVADYFPGAQSDLIAVQDWVETKGSGILWHSTDTAMVSFSRLWKGYISPAHRCVMKYEPHPPLTAEDYDQGWIYALLSENNFGTNFAVSQANDCLFRFTFTRQRMADDNERARWGAKAALPIQTMFTDRTRGGLPRVMELLDVGSAQVLCVKQARNGQGMILRLWNHADASVPVMLNLPLLPHERVWLCDALENNQKELCKAGSNGLHIPGNTVWTLRLV